MAGFVTQDAQQPVSIAALDLVHHLALEPLESRVREVERDCDPRYAVGREPLFRQPHVRPEPDAAPLQLAVDALQPLL